MSSRKRAADEAPTNSIPISQFYNKHVCHERQDKDILCDHLKSLGLQVKSDVPGDGSCFFHAVLDQCNRLKTSTGLPQLTNDTANPQAMGKARAMQLRKAVINYFEDLHPTDPLVMSMDVPGVASSGEVDRMKKYGTFVEEWIIQATAQMLGRDIHIVNSVEARSPTGRMTKICSLTPGEKEPLLVGHLVDGCHYLSLEPASDQSTKSSVSNADLLPPAARRPVTSAEAVSVSSIHSRPNVGSTSFQENQSPLQKSSTPPQKSSTPPQKSPFLPQKYPVPLQTSSTPLQKSSTLHQKSPTPQHKSPTPQQKFPPPPQQRSPAPPSVGHSPIPSVAENTTTSSEKSQSRPSTTLKKREKEASNSPASQMQTITNEPGPRMDSDMAIVTIKDFREVTNALGPDELQHLFHHLDLEERDIENAAKGADTTDPRLQARAVLSMWKKKVGRIATRGALFAAKKKADMEKINQSESKEKKTHEKWRAKLQKSYKKRRGEIKFGSHCKSIADMDHIFVDLELFQIDDKINEKKKQLESYKDLFHIKKPKDNDDQDKDPKDDQDKNPKDKDEQLCTYIILRGNAGSGKSTLVSRISYMWATLGSDEDYKYLQMFDLVITLDVCKFMRGQTLEQAIKRQLLPSVSEETIAEVLSTIGPKCLFLVDGYDELSDESWKDENHVLDSPLLDDSFVILTSRPHVVDKFCQKYQQKCAHIQLSGFSESQVHEYVKRFFRMKSKPYLAESFSDRIKTTPHLKSLSTTPILLLMLCNLGLVHKSNLPESYTQLYVEGVKYLNKHWKESYKGDKDLVLKELGEVALDNLLEGKLTFDTRDDCIANACKIGLVYSEEMDGHRTCGTFIHTTFHEFCAAVFLVSLLETDTSRFNAYLKRIDLYSLILSFCCGLSTKAACSILAFVLRGFHQGDRYKPCLLLIRPFIEALGSKVNPQDDEMFIAELKRSLSETCQSVLALSMGTPALHESIQMSTFLAFLSSLPSTLKSVILTHTNIVDPVDTIMHSNLKPSIKIFKMHYCQISGNTLKRLLACIPHVEVLSLEHVSPPDLASDHEKFYRYGYVPIYNNSHLLLRYVLKCMPYLHALTLKCVNAQELESQPIKSTDRHPLFTELLPSTLKSVILTHTNIVDPVDTIMHSNLKPSIKIFKMHYCQISGNTLKRLLACIPHVEVLSLEHISPTDHASNHENVYRHGYVPIYNNSHLLLRYVLKCMPYLHALTLKCVNAQELESQSFMSSTDRHPLFTELSLSTGEISASSLFQLLCSMPSSLKGLVLNVSMVEGSTTSVAGYRTLPTTGVAWHRPLTLQMKMTGGTQVRITDATLGDGKHVGKEPTSVISLILLMKILGCFPTLDEVYLESIKMESREDESTSSVRGTLRRFSTKYANVQTSFQSFKKLHMAWCNTDLITLQRILSLMSSLKEISLHKVNVLRQGEQDTDTYMIPNSLNKHDYLTLFKKHESLAELGIVRGRLCLKTFHEICKCRPLLEKITLKDMHVIETPRTDAATIGCVIKECEMLHVLVSRKALKSIVDFLPYLKVLTLNKSCIPCKVPHLEVIVECTVGSNAKLEASQLIRFKNCETFLEQLSLIPSIDHVVVAPLLRETDDTSEVPFKNIDSDIFAFANQVLVQLEDKLLNKSFMFNMFCFREHLDTSELSEYHRDLVLSTCNLHEGTLQEIIKCIPLLSKVDMRECAIQLACNADNLIKCQTSHPPVQIPMYSSDWYKPHELCDLAKVHDTMIEMERDLDRTYRLLIQEIPWKFTLLTELAMPEYQHMRTAITLYSCRLTVSKEKLVQILADFKPEEPVILRRIDLQDSSIILQ